MTGDKLFESEKTENGYLIRFPKHKLDDFVEGITPIQNKAKKLGLGEITYEVIETYDVGTPITIQSWKRDYEMTVRVRWVAVKIIGEPPVLDGWKFIASMDASDEFGVLIRKIPDEDEVIPVKYLKDGGNPRLCEQCNRNTPRSKLYIVKNVETGEWRQVGSTCLKDFIGNVTPSEIAQYWHLLYYVAEGSSDMFGGGGFREYAKHNLVEYLTYANMQIRNHGYLSVTRAEELSDMLRRISPTCEIIDSILQTIHTKDNNYDHSVNPITMDDYVKAEQVIDWAMELSDVVCEKSTYMATIRTIAQSGKVPSRHMGYVASMINSHTKHLSDMKRLDKVYEYLDVEVGVRFDIDGAEVIGIRSFESRFGTTFIYDMAKGNNLFVWFTGNEGMMALGDTVSFRATLKKFDDYKGLKQTVVTRAKVTVTKEAFKLSGGES